ncbi:DUF4352 domain-containing protein [Actinoplanes sp. TRM 88003]|uniref:DUF4352 domain-containing protein n=1 Tax=Paractinoplanes aksuensis TaxID=2939490 RepID=A0ABT1E1Y2_9ACTN|nr:DUF4352 domain-containing protein [Actinoplanes aksuensis]MCO8277143.1 DUF4352 domain-containing protein [Actinoplanes aksuensis]
MTQPAQAPIDETPVPARPSRWPWVAGVLVVLLAGAGVYWFVLRDDAGVPQTVTTSGGQLNQAVEDGEFVFTVSAVRCGLPRVGDEFVDLEPQGSYCLVDVLVKNGGTTPEYFDSTSQKAYDAAGAEFGTDMQAEVFVNTDAQNFLDQINPGRQVKGTLVFDVPATTSLVSVVLHESFSSPGARIAVR